MKYRLLYITPPRPPFLNARPPPPFCLRNDCRVAPKKSQATYNAEAIAQKLLFTSSLCLQCSILYKQYKCTLSPHNSCTEQIDNVVSLLVSTVLLTLLPRHTSKLFTQHRHFFKLFENEYGIASILMRMGNALKPTRIRNKNETKEAVLRIRDILVRIRIRDPWLWSRSDSGSCYFLNDLQDGN